MQNLLVRLVNLYRQYKIRAMLRKIFTDNSVEDVEAILQRNGFSPEFRGNKRVYFLPGGEKLTIETLSTNIKYEQKD